MSKKNSWHLIFIIAAVFSLVIYGAFYLYNMHTKRDAAYDVVGTYTGNVNGRLMYYVFEPAGQYTIYRSGVPSILFDEGTYEEREGGIFTLKSAINQEHTVICGDNRIYDCDMITKEVCFADKVTKEIFYVNLPAKAARADSGAVHPSYIKTSLCSLSAYT